MKRLEKLYSEQLSGNLKEIRTLKKEIQGCREKLQRLKNIRESTNYPGYKSFIKEQLILMEKKDREKEEEMFRKMDEIISEFASTIIGVDNGRG